MLPLIIILEEIYKIQLRLTQSINSSYLLDPLTSSQTGVLPSQQLVLARESHVVAREGEPVPVIPKKTNNLSLSLHEGHTCVDPNDSAHFSK